MTTSHCEGKLTGLARHPLRAEYATAGGDGTVRRLFFFSRGCLLSCLSTAVVLTRFCRPLRTHDTRHRCSALRMVSHLIYRLYFQGFMHDAFRANVDLTAVLHSRRAGYKPRAKVGHFPTQSNRAHASPPRRVSVDCSKKTL